MKLDYNLKTPKERIEYAKELLAANPDMTDTYLEYLADYILIAADKQEKKQERNLITDNKMCTIKKREVSFEGLAEQFENGEDGIYGLIKEDKNIIFQPKKEITKRDLEKIPYLKDIKDAIAFWHQQLPLATGKDVYIIKQAIIELGKEQYILKDSALQPISTHTFNNSSHYIPLDSEEYYYRDTVIPIGASLCDPAICSAVLCNYSKLKESGEGVFESDTWYFMEDFDRIADTALKNYPIYEEIVTYKIDGLTNLQIRTKLLQTYGLTYTPEYISSLWRKKIPKLIASAAEDEFLNWYFLNVKPGVYKTCGRCKKQKLAIYKNFTKNSTSKDGLYSICRECRNKKVVPLMKLGPK